MQLFAEKIDRVALTIGDSELAQLQLLGAARAFGEAFHRVDHRDRGDLVHTILLASERPSWGLILFAFLTSIDVVRCLTRCRIFLTARKPDWPCAADDSAFTFEGHDPLATVVAVSREVAQTSARSVKTRLLADFLRTLDSEELEIAVLYLAGEIRQGRIGIGPSVLRACAQAPCATASLNLSRSITCSTS